MMHVNIWLLVSVTDVTVDVSIQKSPSLTLYKSVRGLFLKSCTGNLLKENIRKDHINRSYHLTSEGKGGGAKIPGSLALTDFITSHLSGSLPKFSKPKTQTQVVSCAGSRSSPTTGSWFISIPIATSAERRLDQVSCPRTGHQDIAVLEQ